MAHVAAVRLTYNPKILWFAHNGVEFKKGDNLIVKTERGLEFGRAEEDLKEVTQDQISNLKSPLKPVIRVATPEDEVAWKNLQQQAADALPVFKQMVAEQGLDMHPVTVEYLFDGDKAVFYFESEDRVDFRELVRALAARFHVRIDMRQIGVRDEARIVGGLGHCGQELCCKRLGGEFNPVSIRMAKDQDLSLNPQKISGVCGRLMCCLRYESDIYKEFKTCSPKMNSMIATPKGDAKVIEVNVPRETVTLLTSDDKRVKVPLAEMEVDKKTGKPCRVPADVFDECMNANVPRETVTLLTSDDKRVKVPLAEMEVDKKTGKPCRVPADVFDECMNAVMAGASPVESLVTPIFTGTDAVASNPQARRAKPAAEDQQESASRKPRRRKRAGRTHEAGQSAGGAQQEKSAQAKSADQGSTQRKDASQAKPTRRRRSSTVSGKAAASSDAARGSQQRTDAASGESKQAKPSKSQPKQRKGSGQQQGRSQGQAAQQPKAAQRRDASKRPGQRSSSLSSQGAPERQGRPQSGSSDASAPNAEHRKSRRRSHKAQGGESEK